MKMWYIVVVLALVAARLAAVSGQAISINFTTLPTTGQPINPYNAVAPAVMPSPLPSPSLPPPPPNPDLFVTPGQLNQAKQLNGMLFNSSLTVSSACSYSVLVSDSYGLNTVTCNMAMAAAARSSVRPTSCPQECGFGVQAVGAACTAALQLAYVEKMSASLGPGFNLSTYDPYGIGILCGVSALTPSNINASYQKGLAEYKSATSGTANATALSPPPTTYPPPPLSPPPIPVPAPPKSTAVAKSVALAAGVAVVGTVLCEYLSL